MGPFDVAEAQTFDVQETFSLKESFRTRYFRLRYGIFFTNGYMEVMTPVSKVHQTLS